MGADVLEQRAKPRPVGCRYRSAHRRIDEDPLAWYALREQLLYLRLLVVALVEMPNIAVACRPTATLPAMPVCSAILLP